MSTVDLDTEHTLEWDARPAGGTLSLEVVRPDGQTLTPTVDQAEASAPVLADMAGRWAYRWTSTGPADAHTDIFDVWPADPRFLISVKDASTGLNATRAAADYLEDLRLYIAAATPVIEDIAGPVLTANRTQTTRGGRAAIILHEPSATVTAVEANGIALADWFVEHGVLYAGTRLAPASFPVGEVLIAYTVGGPVVAPNIRLAARELVRHWVQIGKQGLGPARGGEPVDEVFTPSGFAVPRRVVELCAPDEQIGGIA